MKYTPSDRMIHELKQREGFRSHPYKDSGGIWTIGYGTLCDPAKYPDGITPDEALAMLETHLGGVVVALEGDLPGLLQHQVDAVLMFIYNIGWHDWFMSQARKALKARDWSTCFVEWARWVHDAAKHELPGLKTRRDFEIHTFIWGW